MKSARAKARQIEDIYPLTSAQQGILFHCLREPEASVYVSQIAFVIRLSDAESYVRAWQHVVDRHPALRTAVMWEKLEQPVQVVLRHTELPVERRDWRDAGAGERRRWLREYLEQDLRRRFRFRKAPLIRLLLARVAERRYQVVWTYHHVVLDGWSLANVGREVAASYRSFRDGALPSRQPAPPFSDFIAWLGKRDAGAAEAYWRAALAGRGSPPQVAAHGTAGGDAVTRRAVRARRARPRTALRLGELARRHGLTVNSFVQVAWALLLARRGGEDDVIFGSVVAGRPPELPGVESMVGMFINTLPFRIRLRPQLPLLEQVGELQDRQTEMRRFEWSSLVEVQGWSEVPAGTSMFESILAFESYPRTAPEAADDGDGEVTDLWNADRTNYPISVAVRPDLRIGFDYDRRSFDAVSVDRLLRHYHLAA